MLKIRSRLTIADDDKVRISWKQVYIETTNKFRTDASLTSVNRYPSPLRKNSCLLQCAHYTYYRQHLPHVKYAILYGYIVTYGSFQSMI